MGLAAGIGAGGGAILGAIDHNQKLADYNQEKQKQAIIAKYSPWTGIKPNTDLKHPSFMGDVLGGALQGGSLGASAGNYGALAGGAGAAPAASMAGAGAAPTLVASQVPGAQVQQNPAWYDLSSNGSGRYGTGY